MEQNRSRRDLFQTILFFYSNNIIFKTENYYFINRLNIKKIPTN